ncbi:MAG: hypothetical protein V3S01_07660 [Dehalococcoidia bacterium]
MAKAGTRETSDLQLETQTIVAELKETVTRGDGHWLSALLEAVGRWPLAQEQLGDRRYCYLIGGEAFDWLLLAERLCDELEGLIPEEEVEELLFRGWLPEDVSDDDFQQHLGTAKYRAHLNFLYGVRVEEALQMAVQEEVHKERRSQIWENGQVDEEVSRRLYGRSERELLEDFRREHPTEASDRLSLAEWTEFTYWRFHLRIRYADPARVASDTRKGLTLLAYLETRARRPFSVGLR